MPQAPGSYYRKVDGVSKPLDWVIEKKHVGSDGEVYEEEIAYLDTETLADAVMVKLVGGDVVGGCETDEWYGPF